MYSCWLLLAAPVALLWAFRIFAVEFALRSRQMLCETSYSAPPVSAPTVSIILAGKDEENNIEACVRTLLDQDYPNFELIVVDDRSTDRTPQILDRLTTQCHERLRTIRVDTLPPGWFGKHNAMRIGVAAAIGEWFLFVDADCRQTSRRTISLAMSEALQKNVDFLSVLPNLERCTFWEHILQPICASILMVWFRPARINDPHSPAAYANGAFMLMSRACYDAVGGHAAVRDKINEDVHLAILAKKRGQKLRVVENEALYVSRMYESFHGAFHGWSRIFYGCLEKPSRILIAFVLVFGAGFFPALSFLAALALGLFQNESVSWKAAAVWGLVVLLIQSVTARLYSAIGYGFGWAFTYFVGAGVGSVILLNALLKSLGLTRTTWRKTTYSSSTQLTRESASVL